MCNIDTRKIITCNVSQQYPFLRCPSVSIFNAHTFIYFVSWLCFVCRPLVCWFSYYVFTLYLSVYHFALFLRFHNTKAKAHIQRSKILCRFNAVCCGDSLNTFNTFFRSHTENLNCQCNNLLCNHATKFSKSAYLSFEDAAKIQHIFEYASFFSHFNVF